MTDFSFNFTTLPSLALYIHIPWCVRKCPYCDFNSHTAQDTIPEKDYVAALLADLEQELPDIWGRTVQSLFIGGGTPSLFSPESIDELLNGIRARATVKPNAEITLEANPGTVEQQKFHEFKAAGINRLSIGIQSFNNDSLQRIGRIHGRRESIQAAEAAHATGFENFNLDLMFGLPDQSQPEAMEDLQTAIDLEPSHISWYQLTIEPNTYFHYRPPILPDDDALWDTQQTGQLRLREQGYTQYEVSAYARDGWQCAHNLNYWRFGDYLGIGAGAHGKITSAAGQSITRRRKWKSPGDYLAARHNSKFVSGTQCLSAPDTQFEFLLNALRLTSGFTPQDFETATGLPFAEVQHSLIQQAERGLLVMEERIKTTAEGRQFLNELLECFLPDDAE